MTPNLSLAMARVCDVGTIHRIHALTSVDLTARLGPGHWSTPPRREDLEHNLQFRRVYLVSEGDEICATFSLGDAAPHFWPRTIWAEPKAPACCVFNVAVVPALQRRGIGQWAMGEAARIARTEDFRYLRLDAYADNPFSLAFYLRCGFERRGGTKIRGASLVCLERDLLSVAPASDAAQVPRPG